MPLSNPMWNVVEHGLTEHGEPFIRAHCDRRETRIDLYVEPDYELDEEDAKDPDCESGYWHCIVLNPFTGLGRGGGHGYGARSLGDAIAAVLSSEWVRSLLDQKDGEK